MKRLLDHAMEHLYVRVGRWYDDDTLTPPGSVRKRVAWRLIVWTAHYYGYYADDPSRDEGRSLNRP